MTRRAAAAALAALLALPACDSFPVSRDTLAVEPVRMRAYDCTFTTWRFHYRDGTSDIRKAVDCLGNRFYCRAPGYETDARCLDRIEDEVYRRLIADHDRCRPARHGGFNCS